MDSKILEKVLEKAPSQISIDNIKSRFFELFKNKLEKQVACYVKNVFEESYMEIESVSNLSDIQKEIEKLQEKLSEYETTYSNRMKYLNQILEDQEYEKALCFCSLKQEVTRGLMNKIEDRYVERAIITINRSIELQNYLKEKINLQRILI